MKTRLQVSLHSTDFIVGTLTFLCLVFLAATVWFAGPHLHIGHFIPLAQEEKRLYVILFLVLLWILKFLLLDLDHPNPFSVKDIRTQEKLQNLKKRFQGACRFLKKTPIHKLYPNAKLEQLPWYLLIGPTNAGKTALLANAKVHYILHRPLNEKDQQLIPSQHCDWWVTKDVTLIDVPGHYVSAHTMEKNHPSKDTLNPLFWRFLLRLIKKERGKKGINGLVIVLPLPEIIKQAEPKKYHFMLRHLFQRIFELKKTFPQNLPCYLMVTKCDQLTGFTEFFNELSIEEAALAWGITTDPKPGENIIEVFNARFNSLIKKLNQQLIARLHQERNPHIRPFIKDFPLQIERLKDVINDFLKKLTATHFDLSIKGVYLTSALQADTPDGSNIISDHGTQKALQILKTPEVRTRAYFIKQFITQGLSHTKIEKKALPLSKWKKSLSYALSLSTIILAALIFAKDFHLGYDQAKVTQDYLNSYQLAIQTSAVPDRLTKAIDLLDALENQAKESDHKLSLRNLLSFYSRKSQQAATIVYYQSLRNILLPELRIYLEDYLKYPLNKKTDQLYHALEIYLMLGNEKYFQADKVIAVFKEIMPESMYSNSLNRHLFLTLNTAFETQTLNIDVVQQTRKFLLAMPKVQLSYLILKNMNNNSTLQPINLGIHPGEAGPFTSHAITNQLPLMYTSNNFSTILSEETKTAGEEAIFGNWILGNNMRIVKNPDLADSLTEQLRLSYINHYIDTWESLMNNIQLTPSKSLAQTDQIITKMIRDDSPLLQLLQTLHDNTYFEPILSSSFRLQNLGLLIDQMQQPDNLLLQILATLKEVHAHLQTILSAPNDKKAAFAAASKRMANQQTDALTKLRTLAEKSPPPMRLWLNYIANTAWHQIMGEAANYIDTSWQNKVINVYQAEIADRYPFSSTGNEEVEWRQFNRFFGNPGIIMNFYHRYLEAFVETSTTDWHWKKMDAIALPFSGEALHQIQQASLIHKQFFPKGNDQPLIQFSLRRYQFDKRINSVKLNINDNRIVDLRTGKGNNHSLTWPNLTKPRVTSIQLVMDNKKIINRDYPGDWGWFRLVNQSYESVLANNQIVINFSLNKKSAKYVLQTDPQNNPFLTNHLRHFSLPRQLGNQIGV